MLFDLKGKNALVTGASGGIGEAIAKTLGALGATVGISGTREEKLKTLVQENPSCSFHVFPCALTVKEEIQALIPKVESVLGSIDILVNNAGITRDGLGLRMGDEDWDDVIALNLTAAFKLTRGVMKGMMKRRYGRIINISSVVGVTGNPGQANYCASKAGLVGMTKALAAEVASRAITLNCVAPGFIVTPMTHELGAEQKNRLLTAIPSGRLGTPEDVAHAVAFLASHEAAYITGQTLHVNGGMAMV